MVTSCTCPAWPLSSSSEKENSGTFPTPVPRETTPQRSIRQIRMKTQNMLVFTVEFTRTPRLGGGKIPPQAFSLNKTPGLYVRSQKVQASLAANKNPARRDRQ